VHSAVKVIMTSDQNRSGTDRVAEAAEKMGLSSKDIIVNVQGDQPLIDPQCLDEVVRPFYDDPEIGMSTLAFKIVRKEEITNPKHVKVTFDQKGLPFIFQDLRFPLGETVLPILKPISIWEYTPTPGNIWIFSETCPKDVWNKLKNSNSFVPLSMVIKSRLC
jgi:3-deoxy-manno-octulosonate cytidylyltransferase (CMP-KDO synthetase)